MAYASSPACNICIPGREVVAVEVAERGTKAVAVGEVCGHTCTDLAVHLTRLYTEHGYIPSIPIPWLYTFYTPSHGCIPSIPIPWLYTFYTIPWLYHTDGYTLLYSFLPQAFGYRCCRREGNAVEMLLKVTLLLVAIATGVSARRSMQAAHGLPQWQPCMAHSPSVQKLCLSPSAGQPNVTWDNSSGTLTCQVPPYGSQFRFRPACVGMCLYLYDLNCRVETPLSVSILQLLYLPGAQGQDRARQGRRQPAMGEHATRWMQRGGPSRPAAASGRCIARALAAVRGCATGQQPPPRSPRGEAAAQRHGADSGGGHVGHRDVCRGHARQRRSPAAQPCGMVKVPPLGSMVPQLGSCTSSGHAWRLCAARHSQGGPRPRGSQPPPQVLALAASEAAHSTAFHCV